MSTLPLGIILVCIGALCIDLKAYWFGCAVAAFGFLFILANCIRVS